MRRGEIRIVGLDPVVGTESARSRPAVIVSNDGANTVAALLGQGVVTVVPVTSNTDVVYPFQVMLDAGSTGLRLDSKAQIEQIRSVDVRRIGSPVGLVPLDLMARDRGRHAPAPRALTLGPEARARGGWTWGGFALPSDQPLGSGRSASTGGLPRSWPSQLLARRACPGE